MINIADLHTLIGIDISSSIAQIKSDLTTKVKPALDGHLTLKLNFDTSGIEKTLSGIKGKINNATSSSGSQLKLYDVSKLEKDGNLYFKQVNSIAARIKKELSSMGTVDVKSFSNLNGQIQNLTATVKTAEGVIKTFNFERAKLNSNGKNMAGFVQVSGVQDLDKTTGTALERTRTLIQKFKSDIGKIDLKLFGSTDTVTIEQIKSKLGELGAKVKEFENLNRGLTNSEKQQYTNLRSELDLLIVKYNEINKAKKAPASTGSNDDTAKKVSDQVEILRTRIERAKVSWSKMLSDPTIMAQVNQISSALKNVGGDPKAIQALNRQWQILTNGIASADKNQKSFGDRVTNNYKNCLQPCA